MLDKNQQNNLENLVRPDENERNKKGRKALAKYKIGGTEALTVHEMDSALTTLNHMIEQIKKTRLIIGKAMLTHKQAESALWKNHERKNLRDG